MHNASAICLNYPQLSMMRAGIESGRVHNAAMPHAGFVPLRILSSFTMLEGAIDPKKIAKQAKALGFPAAAITDRNGLYGSMAFSDACKSEGVQPIIGAMLGV